MEEKMNNDKLLRWAQSLRSVEGRGLIVTWLRIQDFTWEEIGAKLGMSRNSARQLYEETIKELQKYMNVDQPEIRGQISGITSKESEPGTDSKDGAV